MARFVVAGGGTGGHIFPALAIAREIGERAGGSEILMVGTRRGLEMKVVPEAGLPLATIPVAGLKGKSLAAAARGAAMLPVALLSSWRLLGRRRPDVVIGVGGYASGPVLAAAVLRRTPTLIHEQNLIPGATNRWLAPWVGEVAVTFEETRARLNGRGVVTGNPVRREFAEVPPRPSGRPTRNLLVFGGSQGAAAINRAVAEALPSLASMKGTLRILHQTGEAGLEAMRAAYERAGLAADVRPFIKEMAQAMAEADLILSRAGATTVAELTAAGRGAILVPLPSAIHDHQTWNARTLEKGGAAIVVPQADLTGFSLAALLVEVLRDETRLDAMAAAAKSLGRPDAAARIADLALGLIGARGAPPAPRAVVQR